MENRRPIIVPLNLGSADRFDRSVFPLSGSLNKPEALAIGGVFLDATVDELLSISSMCTSLSECKDFAKTTHFRYAELMQEKIRLEIRTKTLNPFKQFANFRALRIFYNAAKLLYIETKTTSELMIRSLDRESASIPRQEKHSGSDKLPTGPTIKGIRIVTSDGAPDEAINLERTIADAFHNFTSSADVPAVKKFMDQLNTLMGGALDPVTSQGSQAPMGTDASGHTTASQTSSPTTSCTACCSNTLVIKDSIIAPNAIFIGASLSQGHSHNSGPVRHDVTIPPPPEYS